MDGEIPGNLRQELDERIRELIAYISGMPGEEYMQAALALARRAADEGESRCARPPPPRATTGFPAASST
jgi:hypothetical protein